MKILFAILLAIAPTLKAETIHTLQYSKQVHKGKTIIDATCYGMDANGAMREYRFTSDKDVAKFSTFEQNLDAPPVVSMAVIQFNADGSLLKANWMCQEIANNKIKDAKASEKADGVALRDFVEKASVRDRSKEEAEL